MWDWLRAYGVPFYDTFWWVNGIEEYKKIYGRSYAEELRTRGISPEDPAFKAVLDEQRQKASYHFGDPHLNIATLAGIIRMALKAYDAAHSLETERNVTAYINRNGFWQGKIKEFPDPIKRPNPGMIEMPHCRGIRLLGFLRPVQKTVVKFRQRVYDRTKKGGQSTETGGTL